MSNNVTSLAWTVGDRLTKSRRVAGISVEDMADHFGVNRHTIGRWEADKTKPTKAVLMVWAQITDCPLEWLVGTEADPFAEPVSAVGLRKWASGWKLTMRELPLAA